MNPLRIGLLSLASISLISVTGIGIGDLLTPKTIKDELLKEGKQLIPKNDEKWTTLAKNHVKLEKKNSSENNNPSTIQNLTLKDQSEKKEKKEKLQTKCNELLKTPITRENDDELNRKRKEARDWCVLDAKGLNVKK